MKISQITMSASRTINLGNYNSMQVQGSCTIDVDEEDLLDLVRSHAIDEIKEQMSEMFKSLKPNR